MTNDNRDYCTNRLVRSESDFHSLVKLLFELSDIDIETEYQVGDSQKSIDIYLPEYDAAIELKAGGNQRKGIGQTLDYSIHHTEAILLVPEEQYEPDVARIADDSDVGYGYVANHKFEFSIYGTVPFGFWDPRKDLAFEYGPLPEMRAHWRKKRKSISWSDSDD